MINIITGSSVLIYLFIKTNINIAIINPTIVPIILYFKDGSLATTHGIHTAKEFEDLLETQDIRSQ